MAKVWALAAEAAGAAGAGTGAGARRQSGSSGRTTTTSTRRASIAQSSAGHREDRRARRRLPSLPPFGAHDQMVFDRYRAWRSPDGEIAVSPLRDELVAALPRRRGGEGRRGPRQRAQRRGHRLLPQARARPTSRSCRSSSRRLRSRACGDGRGTSAGARGGDEAARLAARARRRHRHLHRRHALRRDFQYAPLRPGGVDGAREGDGAGSRAHRRHPRRPAVARQGARQFFAAVVNPAKPDEYRMHVVRALLGAVRARSCSTTSRTALGCPPPRRCRSRWASASTRPSSRCATWASDRRRRRTCTTSSPSRRWRSKPRRCRATTTCRRPSSWRRGRSGTPSSCAGRDRRRRRRRRATGR